MEQFKKGNVVFWKRPVADLFCIVQGLEEYQVLLYYMDAPRNEPPISVNKSEIVRLAEEQERLSMGNLLEAVRKQRQIHFPLKRGKGKGERRRKGRRNI